MNKGEIVAEIRHKMNEPSNSWDASDLQRACLYWAYHTVKTIRSHGNRAILQAGTCLWPRLRPDQDDGVANTHFGYEWSPEDIASKVASMMGNLPEMHVWAAIPGVNEIIDLTTGYFVAQCQETLNSDWPGDLPPEYFWGAVSSLPKGTVYRPNMKATALALHALMSKFGGTKDQIFIQCVL